MSKLAQDVQSCSKVANEVTEKIINHTK